MRRRTWMLGAAAAVVVAALGIGVVMAQSTPQAGSGTTFLDRVAQKLGIDTQKLRDAVVGARTDQINEAVQNGQLTQKQADALTQKVQNAPDEAFGGRGFGGKGFGEFGKGFGFGLRGADSAQKLADFLGVSTTQLQTQLSAQGATLATVAQANGKSRDEIKQFVRDTVKAQLDAAVSNQDLTQQRADQTMQQLETQLDGIVDSQGGHGGGFKFFEGGRGENENHGAPANPSAPATPAPQSGSSSSLQGA